MAEKFHIGPRRIYDIWNNSERLQQGLNPSSQDLLKAKPSAQVTPFPSKETSIKISQKKKTKTYTSSASSDVSHHLSDTSRRKSDLKKLVEGTEQLSSRLLALPP